MKNHLLLLLLAAVFTLSGAEYKLSNIKLVNTGKKYKDAFSELKYHLELAAGKLTPGKDALQIIIGAPGTNDTLADGEARYFYKNHKLYIWGSNAKPQYVLYAVYEFLEKKLKVRWLYPAPGGVYIPKQDKISFTEGEMHSRIPHFYWGFLRKGKVDDINTHACNPPVWRLPEDALKELKKEMSVFPARHRHGRIKFINYGHAFVKWPDRFAKTRMDYFGVSPYGKPKLATRAKYSKLCLSNPDVIGQIISDWKAKGTPKYLNICPNDGREGFCHCKKCMALDVRKEGENFYSHLTDRYLNFWNRVAKRAVAIRSDVVLVTYIYAYYRYAPRREKIEYPDNMLCGLVPMLHEDSEKLFREWKAAGMKHCFLRPNDTHPAATLMRGMEKHIYNKFQSVRKHFKLYGADYDGTLGVRSRDLEHYVISRMICEPDASFEQIIDEFCSAFGPAGNTVKAFYTNVRPAGEKMYFNSVGKNRKLLLDDSELESVVNKEYVQVMTAELKKLKDFPQDKLSEMEKIRLKRLILTIEQSLLTAEFMHQGDLRIAKKKNNFKNAAKALWDFRVTHAAFLQEGYGEIIRRSELKYWSHYRPYINAISKTPVKQLDQATGWRHSFDQPSMQGWGKRNAFKEITNSEASYGNYSIAAKPVPGKGEFVMYLPGVEVTPDAKYSASFDVKAPQGGDFSLRIANKSRTMKRIKVSAKGNNWHKGSDVITIPADLDQVNFYISIGNAPDGGFIDRIEFIRINNK